MSTKRKVCVVTGSRAEYGLLYWIIKGIQDSEELELQLLVTGMHLSPEFGLTYREIHDDGFKITKKIEILLSSDTPSGVSKSIGLGLIGFADAFQEIEPDVVVLLGDRFELLSACSAALVTRIPVAHIHGGETTLGAFDEAIRHSITKMSHLHFTSTGEYRDRVIQLGENPTHVFNVGAPGIDNICKLKSLTREQFQKSIDFILGDRSLLVTYHPVTLDDDESRAQFSELLDALNRLENTNLLFTKTNSDTYGRVINEMIDSFVSDNKATTTSFTSLGRILYLTAMRHVDGMIGNSSSGIIESPSMKLGTVNVGDRQKGRVRAGNVIDCDVDSESISEALQRLFSAEFVRDLQFVTNPHGDGGASKEIVDKLKTFPLDNILKKEFFDIVR